MLYHPHFALSASSPSLTYGVDYEKQTSSGNKMSPALLFIIVILAVVFFITGLLCLLVRFLIRHRSSSSVSESSRYPEISGPETFQRQLQQLFHLHDAGLDQAFIDALPVFFYKEIMGLKEPFDCAVCLCEFFEKDKLRLLPLCSHAFHIDCIDTWLLSNSSCPLCRGSLFAPGFAIENPVFDHEEPREENEFQRNAGNGDGVTSLGQKPAENAMINSKRVFSVRLGKFRSSTNVLDKPEGETSTSSTSNLVDARRCYSMGSYQYVVADMDLQVALAPVKCSSTIGSIRIEKDKKGQNVNPSHLEGDLEGKKINVRSKGESFSVSKIWQWSKKGKFPGSSSETQIGSSCSSSVNIGLAWNDCRITQDR